MAEEPGDHPCVRLAELERVLRLLLSVEAQDPILLQVHLVREQFQPGGGDPSKLKKSWSILQLCSQASAL